MKLTDLLPIGKEEKREFYWSLVIEPGWVQAGIWSIEVGVAQVVSISPGAAWEVDEDLVSASDAALSAAIQKLPEEFGEPQKTVFGLPNSWIEKGQIKEEHLAKIKKICTELSLEPAGFVIISEAIAHLVKSEEGAPVNAVVLGIGKETLEISVFKLGNLIGTSEVARSVSLADDAIEGLARFPKTDSFPSRFLIYDGKEGELEEAKQSLLDANWEESENIKFLHTPKIEIIKPDQKILATSLAGASEIGQVSKVFGITDNLPKNEPKKETNVVEPENQIKPEDLGFVVDEDISKRKTQTLKEAENIPEPKVTQVPLRRRVPKFNLSRLTTFLGNIGKSVSSISNIAPSITLAILFVLFLSAWWFLPKASVTVYVSPKTLEEKGDLTIDTTKSVSDFDHGIIAGRVLKTEVSGEKTVPTSGTKLVGERATGTVKIQNGLASPINLQAGTVLIAANDLRFLTTKTASVSAALSPSDPGIANIEVTAGDIGAQYNLAKDESFKVGNYPKADVDAVSVADFTGGSSRQITAVSQDDQDALVKDLTKELIEKSKTVLMQDVSPNETFVEGGLAALPLLKDFNHKVGEESANLKLSLKISATTFAVDKKELFEYSKRILKDKVPSGYALTEEEVETSFDIKNQKDGKYEVTVVISINLLPELDKNDIARKISGKYPRLVENFLNSIPGFTRAEIRIVPRLPGFLGTLPHVAKRIKIEVVAEK